MEKIEKDNSAQAKKEMLDVIGCTDLRWDEVICGMVDIFSEQNTITQKSLLNIFGHGSELLRAYHKVTTFDEVKKEIGLILWRKDEQKHT